MKKLISLSMLQCLLFISFIAASAQGTGRKQGVPRWVSIRGYWVEEHNVKTPGKGIIYFYNNNDILVYKENIWKPLNLKKRRVLLRLKKVVDQSVIAWEREPV